MKKQVFALRIEQAISEKGITPQELRKACDIVAKEIGIAAKITTADISRYRHAYCCPKKEKLTLLAVALGKSEMWLLGYTK